jgi:hypothetical protein
VLVLSGLLAACGGGGGSDSGIASINGKERASNASSKKSARKQDAQDAFRKYAQCMRQHGIDMPDPKFSGNGAVEIGPPPGSSDGGDGTPTGPSPGFDAADKACRHFVDDVVNSSDAPKVSPQEQEKLKEAALAFAQCMRKHGIDMPDPTFSGGGRVEQRLGGNPNQADFQAAQKACQKLMPIGKKGKGGGLVTNNGGGGPKSGSTSRSAG